MNQTTSVRRGSFPGEPLRTLRRRWRVILLLALLSVAVAAAWSLGSTPVYQATASVLLRPIVADPSAWDGDRGQVLMGSEWQVAHSIEIARLVAESHGTSATPEQLLEHVSVDVPANSQVLRISYADTVPLTAQKGADAFAEAFLIYHRGSVAAQVRSLQGNLARQVADLTAKRQSQEAILAPDTKATPAQRNTALTLREAYSTRLLELEEQRWALRRIDATPGSVIQPARLPTVPASPTHARNVGLGLVAGLLLGVAVAFIHDRIDDRLRGRDDLAERLDRPVLALIPAWSRWTRGSGRLGWRRRDRVSPVMVDEPNGPAAEAYRSLRTRVERLAAQFDVASIMVTSAAPGEGKSTTAANLALALAEAGRDVLLISADLRRPRLHQLFALPNESGLADLLGDGAVATERWTKEPGKRTTSELWSVAAHLWVIVSAPLPPSDSALLGSRAMCDLVKSQRDVFDFIVLDCPPMLVVADSLALAPLVDGVLVVADAKWTERAAVGELRDQLEQVGGRILGAVINRTRSRDPYHP